MLSRSGAQAASEPSLPADDTDDALPLVRRVDIDVAAVEAGEVWKCRLEKRPRVASAVAPTPYVTAAGTRALPRHPRPEPYSSCLWDAAAVSISFT